METKYKIENLDNLYDAFVSHKKVKIICEGGKKDFEEVECYFIYNTKEVWYGLFKNDSVDAEHSFFPKYIIEEKKINGKYIHKIIDNDCHKLEEESLSRELFNEYLKMQMCYNENKTKRSDFIIENKTIYGYTGKEKEIIIPDDIDAIVDVSDRDDKSNLESIIIPPGVVTIMPDAFGKCEKLKQIVFPYTVRYIGNDEEDIFPISKKEQITVFYLGTELWQEYLDDAHISNIVFFDCDNEYYYCEKRPKIDAHKYWHFVDGKPVGWKDNK